MNPFLAFCLYVAARVFVQYLKFRPKDHQMLSSLKFLLDAMQALKRKNPLTESFLAQLDVDLEGAGIDVGQRNTNFYKKPPIVCPDLNRVPSGLAKINDNLLQFEIPQNTDSVKCSPLFEIRDSQTASADINAYSKLQNPQPDRPIVPVRPSMWRRVSISTWTQIISTISPSTPTTRISYRLAASYHQTLA